MLVSYNSMHTIDINCDLGEGCKNDGELMQYISSANIACGYHAGNEETIKKTIDLCLINKVAIGAHPGFKDKENFGRINRQLSDCELYDLVAEQIILMQDHCKRAGSSLHHIKPHGALYNMAAANETMSYIIASVIKELDASLIVYGLSNSHLITEAKKLGLTTASEVFADRTYTSEGLLISRSLSYSIITDEEKAIQQALQMIEYKTVTAYDKTIVAVEADTICLHGDNNKAVDFAKVIRRSFINKKINVQTI